MSATIYAHPELTAEAAERLALDTGLELMQTAAGNFTLQEKQDEQL